MKSHANPLQVAVPLAGAVHDVHELAPQESTEVFETHALPQRWKPELQAKSHAPLPQNATEFGGGVHGEQLVPQVAMSLSLLHSLPQRWLPGLQVKSQRLPVQAATALAMPSQLAHEGPQAPVLLSASQV